MKLRWAIRGCGKIAEDFVHALKHESINEHHEVVSLCSSSLARCEDFAWRLSLQNVKSYDNEETMYAEGGFGKRKTHRYFSKSFSGHSDLIYIANRNHEHCQSTLNALKHKRNVLCEKPLGVNAKEVRAMSDAAKVNGAFLMEVFRNLSKEAQ